MIGQKHRSNTPYFLIRGRPEMPITVGQDNAKTRKTLTVGGQSVSYYSIPAAQAAGLGDFSRLPAALKVVLENMLRFEDGKTVSVDDIRAFRRMG
jgi:aconitate hydratase